MYTDQIVGAELAREGGLTAGLSLAGVHIHSCGNGHLGFRPYGEALLSNALRVRLPVALVD
jgi:hypothetical protein